MPRRLRPCLLIAIVTCLLGFPFAADWMASGNERSPVPAGAASPASVAAPQRVSSAVVAAKDQIGRETQHLMMMVTPRGIYSESDEEERLGIAPLEPIGTADAPAADMPEHVQQSLMMMVTPRIIHYEDEDEEDRLGIAVP